MKRAFKIFGWMLGVVAFAYMCMGLFYVIACGDCDYPLGFGPPGAPPPSGACLCDYGREARDPLYHCDKLDAEMDLSRPGCLIPPERLPNRSQRDLGPLPTVPPPTLRLFTGRPQ